MLTEDDVRRVALSLPAVQERLSYGTAAWHVNGKVFARMHEEARVLVLWCAGEHEKRVLLTEHSPTVFTTPHYDGHASVLVRLDAVGLGLLEQLIQDAWRARAPRHLL
ncbi:MAG TPA: MmcQ/YjbR family DNA-binding protein [Egibacteraceae bacterium]|nr:MmcQ/YjbR family DNA-binding protein [Egibacteraceae bacterium]